MAEPGAGAAVQVRQRRLPLLPPGLGPGPPSVPKRRRNSPPYSPAELIAWAHHGTVNVRVHARVVEGTREYRHRDRTCPATADGSLVIAALPGGDTADNQPDDKKHRSDVHLGLRSIICVNLQRRPIRLPPLRWSGSWEGAYPGAAAMGPASGDQMPFPEIWESGLGRRVRWQFPDVWKLPVIR